MKKRLMYFIAFAALAALCLGFTGCGKKGDNGTLTIFNYGEYMDMEVLDMFTEETGIKVLYEEALTPEEMYTKYKSGAIEYDLLCTSEYMLQRLMSEGELQPIDIGDMEYSGNIGERYWEFARSFDPENKYVVPYFWGTVGILYDEDKVNAPVDSWDVLFNGEYKDEIIMMKSMRDSYMVALKYLGYSLNTENEDEIMEAHNLLLKQKPDVQAYLVDEARDELVAGNAAMAVIYSGEAYLGRQYGLENGRNLRYVIPKEGSNVWLDCFAVTKHCDDMDAAQKFLDFLCREDVAMMNFEYIYYSTPNEAVIEELSDEERADEALVPSDDAMDNCEVYTMTNTETTEMMNRLWKELGAE